MAYADIQVTATTIRIGGDDGVDSVHAVLYAASVALAGVEVREMAPDDSSGPAEFRARTRFCQFGYSLDRAKLEATHASRPSDALRGVPGVTLLPSRRIGNLVRLRGWRPTIWIDGTRAAAKISAARCWPGLEFNSAASAALCAVHRSRYCALGFSAMTPAPKALPNLVVASGPE